MYTMAHQVAIANVVATVQPDYLIPCAALVAAGLSLNAMASFLPLRLFAPSGVPTAAFRTPSFN